jgi:hypothetical protein
VRRSRDGEEPDYGENGCEAKAESGSFHPEFLLRAGIIQELIRIFGSKQVLPEQSVNLDPIVSERTQRPPVAVEPDSPAKGLDFLIVGNGDAALVPVSKNVIPNVNLQNAPKSVSEFLVN